MELIAQLVINISTPRLRWQADYTRSPIAWLFWYKNILAAKRWWCDQSSGRYEEQSSIGLKGKKLGVGGGVLICSELAQGEGNSFLSPSRCTRGHKIPGYIKVLSSTKSLPLQTFRVRRSGWHPQLPLAGMYCGITTNNWLYNMLIIHGILWQTLAHM